MEGIHINSDKNENLFRNRFFWLDCSVDSKKTQEQYLLLKLPQFIFTNSCAL